MSAIPKTPAWGDARCQETIEWLRDYVALHVDVQRMDERRALPDQLLVDFGRRRLFGLNIPANVGGLGLTLLDGMRVVEQLAALDLTLALVTGIANALVARPVHRFGTVEQTSRLLPALCDGRLGGSFALSEPEAGSHLQRMSTQATAFDDGSWRLSGHKMWVGMASQADLFLLFAVTADRQTGARGWTAFLVPATTTGVTVGPEQITAGLRAATQHPIQLTDVRVDADAVLGSVGRGAVVAADAMAAARLGIGFMSLGCMKRCAQLMAQFAAGRTIATGRLLDNTTTRTYLSAAIHSITGLEALVQRSACQMGGAEPTPPELPVACKIAGSELASWCTDRLVQLAGARGYLASTGVPQLWRDARGLRILEGPTESLTMWLGSRLLHRRRGLLQMLRERWRAPVSADAIAAATEQLNHAVATGRTPVHAPAQARQWAAAQLGTIATWGIVAAALEADATTASGTEADAIGAAYRWFQQRTADAVAHAGSTQDPLLSAGSILDRTAAYAATIGQPPISAAEW